MRKYKKIWLIIPAILILLGISLIPTKNYLEYPGGAYNVNDYLTVKQAKKKLTHNFYFTAVSIRPALVIDYLTAPFQQFSDIIPRVEIDGDLDHEDSSIVDDIYMSNSVSDAKYVAATNAKIPVKQEFAGVYVLNVLEKSTFFNKLKIGDLITSVENQQFQNSAEMMDYIGKQKLGQKIEIVVERDDQKKTFFGKIITIDQKKNRGIGIGLIEKEIVTTTPNVEVDTQNIGGPSAGLMFSLDLYQEFTGKQLFDGKKVAGTGTIDQDGHVGSIGGIDKKVVAAARAGAKIFFCPKEVIEGEQKSESNAAIAKKTAKAIKTKMKIVPVDTFIEAKNYLTQHK